MIHTVVCERPRDYPVSLEKTERLYGRILRWGTNDPLLEKAIAELLDRWKSVEVPFIGGNVFATAVRVKEDESTWAVGHVMTSGVLLARGFSSFSFLAPDQKNVTTVVAGGIETTTAVEYLIEPVWFGLFTKPPLYGLHAGAVARDSKTTLFLGEHEAGKSSLVAGLVSLAGYSYLSDDVVLLDGRNLCLYGRPWRIELRRDAWEALLPPERAISGKPHHTKRYWDGRHLFEGRFATMGMPVRLCFVQRGKNLVFQSLSLAETRRHLGAPILMYGRRHTRWGYQEVFRRLCSIVPGYRLTLDHSQDLIQTVAAVAEWLDKLDRSSSSAYTPSG